jgi:hypothetical protein
MVLEGVVEAYAPLHDAWMPQMGVHCGLQGAFSFMVEWQREDHAMHTREGLLTLVAKLDGNLRELNCLEMLNQHAWDRFAVGTDDARDLAALAFTIYSIYGVLENSFLRISKLFENNLPPGSWHTALIERMALEIPGLRPALLTDRSDRNRMMELLKFRLRFGDLYGEDLDVDKTVAIQQTARAVVERFPAMYAVFRGKLLEIADKLD